MNDILLSLSRDEAAMLRVALVNARGVPFRSKPDTSCYSAVIERLRSQPDELLRLAPGEALSIAGGIRAFASEFWENVPTYTGGANASELLRLADKIGNPFTTRGSS